MKHHLNKIFPLLLLPLSSAPARPSDTPTRARYLMGTLCEISARGPDSAVTSAFDEIARIERILSTHDPDSAVSRLNLAGRANEVSPVLWNVLALSARFARLSGGAFDPTYGSPPASRGWRRVRLEPAKRSVRLDPGARLDFGAIGKGYALDAAAAVLRRGGVRSARLNFGGQVLVYGPPPEGTLWPVVLSGTPSRAISIKEGSVSVSGHSERPGHIMDPSTGRATLRDVSVAVVMKDAASADAWSTALFVSGPARVSAGFSGCAVFLGTGGSAELAGDCRHVVMKEGIHENQHHLDGPARPYGLRAGPYGLRGESGR